MFEGVQKRENGKGKGGSEGTRERARGKVKIVATAAKQDMLFESVQKREKGRERDIMDIRHKAKADGTNKYEYLVLVL